MNDLKIAESADVAVTVAVKSSGAEIWSRERPIFTGAACQNRTDDLLITSEMLYQLS